MLPSAQQSPLSPPSPSPTHSISSPLSSKDSSCTSDSSSPTFIALQDPPSLISSSPSPLSLPRRLLAKPNPISTSSSPRHLPASSNSSAAISSSSISSLLPSPSSPPLPPSLPTLSSSEEHCRSFHIDSSLSEHEEAAALWEQYHLLKGLQRRREEALEFEIHRLQRHLSVLAQK
mmetsp:Transcript_1207/g.1768  ORF Transcript_1207/g.1768 Transcript_1207/m.1768 type:complete len:175 (+) Transcript_1207:2124-2648(+)